MRSRSTSMTNNNYSLLSIDDGKRYVIYAKYNTVPVYLNSRYVCICTCELVIFQNKVAQYPGTHHLPTIAMDRGNSTTSALCAMVRHSTAVYTLNGQQL